MEIESRPVFPVDEYRVRLARLRERMQELDADLVLLDESEAMAWIAGYAPSLNRYRYLLVPADADPVMLLRRLDEAPCREQS